MYIHVFWSDEDQCYIATCPGVDEFKYLSAFGDTSQDACDEFRILMDGVKEVYADKGWSWPVIE